MAWDDPFVYKVTKIGSTQLNALIAYIKAHKSQHQSGGTDAIKLDDLGTPDDNTDLDVSTSRHGLCPKLDGVTTHFLRSDGAQAVPVGAAGIGGATGATDSAILLADGVSSDTIKTSSKTIVTTIGAVDTTVPTCKAVKDVTDLKAPIASPTFTGNVTIPAGTHSITISDYINLMPGGSMVPTTNPAGIDQAETTTNKNNYIYGLFTRAGEDTENLQWIVNLPPDETSGNFTATYFWMADAGSNDCSFNLAARRFTNGYVIDASITTITDASANDTLITAGKLHSVDSFSSFSIPGVGNTIIFKLTRTAADTDNTADIKVLGIRLKYSRALV